MGEDRGHLPDTRQAHLQGARNRRGGERQHIHVRPQSLDMLLVLHPKALFLIDDNEPQVLPLHARLQQPVSANHDVDGTVTEPGEDLPRLCVGGKAG